MTGKALFAYSGRSYSLGVHTQTLPSKPDLAPFTRALDMRVPSSSLTVCLNSVSGPVGRDTSGSALGAEACFPPPVCLSLSAPVEGFA